MCGQENIGQAVSETGTGPGPGPGTGTGTGTTGAGTSDDERRGGRRTARRLA